MKALPKPLVRRPALLAPGLAALPAAVFENLQRAGAAGVEVAARLAPAPAWRPGWRV
jgi:hypothetical protein